MLLQQRYIFIFLQLALILRSVHGNDDDYLTFPPGFIIGSATASYQVEGAWNVSDKGENMWDHYTHTEPDRIGDKSNGDVACDSYHKYKEDIQLLKEMGMDFYRFSLSWSRILPTGYANNVSKDGVRYYHSVLDELEKHNITPMVSIYHWDHPQLFQYMGGWMNEIMVELFADYARVIFNEFGHRVKIFATINEPQSVCETTYLEGKHSPGLKLGRHAAYLCAQNVLKAHARAYHIYDEEFRSKYNGKIGIVIEGMHHWSKDPLDKVSNEVAFQFKFGIYAHPIFSQEGDWPAVVKQRVNDNSKFEKLPRSRLPPFSKYWIDYIKGTYDYLGFNHYTSMYAEAAPPSPSTIYPNDDGLSYSYDPRWPETASSWLRVIPEGFLGILLKIKEEYNNPLVYVTENGLADNGTTLKDDQRLEYFHSYMKNMLIAINKHGCNVKAYTVWSLLDNFEWDRGYLEKFGLFQVDFNSPNRTRTPKQSTRWLKNVIRSRNLTPVDKAVEQI